MKVVFVRHGQTPSNCIHALDTAYPGADLDQVGKTQAETLAANWKQIVGVWPDLIFASDLARTQQTAAPLRAASQAPLYLRSGLREVPAGQLEMLTDTESLHTYLACAFSWISGDLDRQMPGGPDGREVCSRLLGVVNEAVTAAERQVGPDATIALVSHGVACRIMVSALAENVPDGLVSHFPMGNATTSVIERSRAGEDWQLQTWSNLPLEHWHGELANVDLAGSCPQVSSVAPPLGDAV